MKYFVSLFCLAFLIPSPALAGTPTLAWGRSIVSIEVSRKQYDYVQPWSKSTTRAQKTGVVIGDNEILTTADELFNRTLIRLQKGGRGIWYPGDLVWIDYHANLALVRCADASFSRDLKPVKLGGRLAKDGGLQVIRWRNGTLESRHAEFTRFAVREGDLSPVNHVVMETDCDIQGAGFGEPVVADSHIIGLLTSADNKLAIATPASFIQSILEARKAGTYHGLGYFHFFWQPAENPEVLAALKVPGAPRGVVVHYVPERPDGGERVLKARDVLLRIDGFDLDTQGDYQDPEFGHLLLENLATRRKWAGQEVPIQICRDGKIIEVSYRLPAIAYTNSLVPRALYDREPEYLILGGLVFQPLTDSYMEAWGADWKRRAPFRLTYYRNEAPTKERPALVMLSQVLPDAFNTGYQEQKFLIVDKVNGQTVATLEQLQQALKKPQDGVHTVELARSDSLRKIVVAAGEPEQQATARVLKRYGIDEPARLESKSVQ
jgi:hypothetical protein